MENSPVNVSKTVLAVLLLVFVVFAAAQELVLMNYDALNVYLQTEFEKCEGIRRVK